MMLAGLSPRRSGARGRRRTAGDLGATGIQFPLILVQAVGFLLLLLLRAIAFRPIWAFSISARGDCTRYSDAEKARDVAEQVRRDYEARLAQIDAEARDRIQDGIREGQAMRTELIAQAQQERADCQQGHREVTEEREKMIYSVRETWPTWPSMPPAGSSPARWTKDAARAGAGVSRRAAGASGGEAKS